MNKGTFLGVVLVVLGSVGITEAQRFYKQCGPDGCFMVPANSYTPPPQGILPRAGYSLFGPTPKRAATYSMFSPEVVTTTVTSMGSCGNPDCTNPNCQGGNSYSSPPATRTVKETTKVYEEPVVQTVYSQPVQTYYYQEPVTYYESYSTPVNAYGSVPYYGAVRANGSMRPRGLIAGIGRAIFGRRP